MGVVDLPCGTDVGVGGVHTMIGAGAGADAGVSPSCIWGLDGISTPGRNMSMEGG